MKILTVCAWSTLALVAGAASAYAADVGKMVVTRVFNDSVAPAEQKAYEAGIKAFNECLHRHDFKYNVYALLHETGDTYTYSYVLGPYTWADMDTNDATTRACDATFGARVNPHIKSETSGFMVDQPDLSHMPAGWRNQPPPPLEEVEYFIPKHGHAAREAVASALKKIAEAAAKSHWPYYNRTLAMLGGGWDAPDYVLIFPEKSWADYGAEANPPLWKMVEGVYGKKATDALRKSLDDSIEKSSDRIERYNAGLSYIAGK